MPCRCSVTRNNDNWSKKWFWSRCFLDLHRNVWLDVLSSWASRNYRGYRTWFLKGSQAQAHWWRHEWNLYSKKYYEKGTCSIQTNRRGGFRAQQPERPCGSLRVKFIQGWSALRRSVYQRSGCVPSRRGRLLRSASDNYGGDHSR